MNRIGNSLKIIFIMQINKKIIITITIIKILNNNKRYNSKLLKKMKLHKQNMRDYYKITNFWMKYMAKIIIQLLKRLM